MAEMEISTLFWIFILVMTLQPVIRQKAQVYMRQRLIYELQKANKSRVITMVHRQESMQFFGFPVMRYIDMDDSEAVIRAIHQTDKTTPIDLIIHTPGGLVLASLQIANALKQHKARITVYVPHMAMSGGTLIALAADEIVMCDHSVLGPIDPQIGKYPAASLLKVVKDKPIAEIDDETLILADMGAKATEQVHKSCAELLADRLSPQEAEQLAKTLTNGQWTHDYPITALEAKKLGLPINTDMPETVLDLMALYPQAMRNPPSVEYLAAPAGPTKSNRH
jgi:ClpP class serine protease